MVSMGDRFRWDIDILNKRVDTVYTLVSLNITAKPCDDDIKRDEGQQNEVRTTKKASYSKQFFKLYK